MRRWVKPTIGPTRQPELWGMPTSRKVLAAALRVLAGREGDFADRMLYGHCLVCRKALVVNDHDECVKLASKSIDQQEGGE